MIRLENIVGVVGLEPKLKNDHYERRVGMNIPQLKELNTQEMIGDAKMIFILHLGQRYLLSVTKQQKTIADKSEA